MRKDKLIKGILEIIKTKSGIDFRYDHFRQSEAVPPPFIVYRRVAPDTFSADGITFNKGQNVDIELYAEDEDQMAEIMEQIEELLDQNGIYYRLAADTVYIQSEDFYETLYEV